MFNICEIQTRKNMKLATLDVRTEVTLKILAGRCERADTFRKLSVTVIGLCRVNNLLTPSRYSCRGDGVLHLDLFIPAPI